MKEKMKIIVALLLIIYITCKVYIVQRVAIKKLVLVKKSSFRFIQMIHFTNEHFFYNHFIKNDVKNVVS